MVTVCCVVFRKGISERIDRLKVSLSQAEAQLRQHSSAVSYFESLAGRQADASCDDNECVICFEPMVRLTVLPCGHLFCNACITSCLAANGLCPTCRRSVKIDELVEVKVIDICLSLNSSNRCSASVIKAVMTGPVFLQLDVITDKQTGTSVMQVNHMLSAPVAGQVLLLLLHPFNGLFSRTTWVSQYQKGKPVWI